MTESMFVSGGVKPYREIKFPPKRFHCEVCDLGFDDELEFTNHVAAEREYLAHGESCDWCSRSFCGEYIEEPCPTGQVLAKEIGL